MDWVMDINCKLQNMSEASKQEEEQRKKWSIYQVPSTISDLNKRAYTPQTASFGPYHHGNYPLLQMEAHKQRALLHFLKRSPHSLQSIFDTLIGSADELKECYQPMTWTDTKEKFVEMMIVDGCFILEIVRVYSKPALCDYEFSDPVFGDHGKVFFMPFVRIDMLLLENQIPMSVLFKLFGVKDENDKETIESLYKLILNFCNPDADFFAMENCVHVLDLYRKSLLFRRHTRHMFPRRHIGKKGDDPVVRSAMELHEAGISFKQSKTQSLRDISFKRGVLRLPHIVVDDTTETTFLNLIAYERCHVGLGYDITSFIYLMDNIIDHGQDVSLLTTKGIIQNVTGSDKAAAKLFNSMAKDLAMDPNSYLTDVQCRIAYYCKKPWNIWRANLYHTYFTSPWSVISVIGALLLFALTIVQTTYSVLAYIQGNQPK